MRRAITLFLLKQRFSLGGPIIYFEHIRKVHRKVSEDFQTNEQTKSSQVLKK